MPPRRVVIVAERLETRQFLAGDAAACAEKVHSTSIETPAVTAPLAAAIAPTAPVAERFVGTFRGLGSNPKKRFDLNLFDIELVVTSASDGGFVGSITIDTSPYGGNRREVAASFTGKLKPKGAFAFRLHEPGRRVAFKGRLTLQTDRIIGSVRMKIGPGTGVARGDVGGKFQLKRETEPPVSTAP